VGTKITGRKIHLNPHGRGYSIYDWIKISLKLKRSRQLAKHVRQRCKLAARRRIPLPRTSPCQNSATVLEKFINEQTTLLSVAT